MEKKRQREEDKEEYEHARKRFIGIQSSKRWNKMNLHNIYSFVNGNLLQRYLQKSGHTEIQSVRT